MHAPRPDQPHLVDRSRLLLVDDNELSLPALAALLEPLDADLRTAGSGREAARFGGDEFLPGDPATRTDQLIRAADQALLANKAARR